MHFLYTYLSHPFEETEDEYPYSATVVCHWGSQQCQNSRPPNAEQHEHFSTDLLCQSSAEDLRRRVAVEECSKNKALNLLVPI